MYSYDEEICTIKVHLNHITRGNKSYTNEAWSPSYCLPRDY